MKFICNTFAFILLSFFAKAQSQISGKLLDDKKEGLAFANILLHKPDSSLYKGALTDDAGAYLFEEISSGTYFISIQYVGFEKYYSSLIDIKKTTQLDDIQLIVMAKTIGEVVVVGKKPLLEMRGDKLVMNIESSPIASQGTALDALRRAPGVMVRQEKEIVMRGKNGVLIMIDDKPTQMSEEDLLRFLQSMPASSIDRIEIINNPSSRYDAAGTSGIINIKLKKDKNLGFNGTAALTFGYGFTPKYNLNVNTNYRTKKYNIFANLTPGRWQNRNIQKIDRDFYQNSKLTTFNQVFTETYKDTDGQAKVGVDFFLNDKTTLGLMTTAYGGKTNNNLDNVINILGYNPDIYDKITAIGGDVDRSNRMAYNINFK